MTKKNIFPVVATIAVVGVVLDDCAARLECQHQHDDFRAGICQLEQQDEAHRRAGGQGQSSAAGCL